MKQSTHAHFRTAEGAKVGEDMGFPAGLIFTMMAWLEAMSVLRASEHYRET